jgi:hypothetical protein
VSFRTVSLSRNLTGDIIKESKKIVNGDVYVENTQEELYTPQQKHVEDMEVHVIPESVDDVIDIFMIEFLVFRMLCKVCLLLR